MHTTLILYRSAFDEAQKEEAHTSLPSSELKGAQPSEHTGGVGALPGTISESSVALLPDERAERRGQTSTPKDTGTPQRETPLKESSSQGVTDPVVVAAVAGKDEVGPFLFGIYLLVLRKASGSGW